MTNKTQKTRPSLTDTLLELATGIIIPTLILKKLSGADALGGMWALIIALSFPVGYSMYQFMKNKKVGFIPILGFFSVLLTGGIGLLGLDSKYFAFKEALIPLVIGVATLVSTQTRYPLIKTFIFNDNIMNTDKITLKLADNNTTEQFNKVLDRATYCLAGSFLLSSMLNYILAKIIVTARAGDLQAFNDQVGTMNLLSYPVIVLPCMMVMFGILYYVFKKITAFTGLTLQEVVPDS